jgi:hypothetical protein
MTKFVRNFPVVDRWNERLHMVCVHVCVCVCVFVIHASQDSRCVEGEGM